MAQSRTPAGYRPRQTRHFSGSGGGQGRIPVAREVASGVTICRDLLSAALGLFDINGVADIRSKFNVPLGIEAQGFCMLGARP